MKKIILLSVILLTASLASGQTYLEYSNDQGVNPSSRSVIERLDNNRPQVVTTYDLRDDFLDACPNSADLLLESFEGGPGVISVCGTEISSAGDSCFSAGELVDGFNIQASVSGDVVLIPSGAIGNTSVLVGASAFANFTIINFTDANVNSLGIDIWENNDPTTIIRVFGASGLLETYSVLTGTNTESFFGFIADEPISKVEVEGNLGSGELVGNMQFGNCTTIIGFDDNLLSQVSVYPNPTTDILNVKVPANITVNSASLVSVLGANTGLKLVNGTINTSSLASGVYILTVNTSAGTMTQKVVKQ